MIKKKTSFFIPLFLIGIVVILVLIKAFNHNVFKRTPAETLQIANERMHIIGPDVLTSMQTDKVLILEIGVQKVIPSFPSEIEIKSIEFNRLLSKETRKIFADKKKKVLFAENVSEAAKVWTLLTSMGYNDLLIYDPDQKKPAGTTDTILNGNEELHYSFKPDYTELK